LNALPNVNKNFKWNTSVNFWLNRSKITKLTIPPVQLGALAGGITGNFPD
jgi:hypothetical protein